MVENAMMAPPVPLRCADCGKEVARPIDRSHPVSIDNSRLDITNSKETQNGAVVEFWWCRDCVQGVCK
uniref:TFIIS-type domain-containing protein n=1 Tax=Heterorhabditis bacteriophora TaxID=37862 RepID=A0A1I7XNJ5_HETBA